MANRSAGRVALITESARGIGASEDAWFAFGRTIHVAGGPRG
jgi:hypothetical protein